MQRAVYTAVVDGEATADAVAWHNMAVADKFHLVDLFSSAAYGWLRASSKDKTFRDLEVLLRERKLQTHLIAIKPRAGFVLRWPPVDWDGKSGGDGVRKLASECLFSCRPSPHAMNEVLQHWPTYAANLAALETAGCATVGDLADLKSGGVAAHPNTEILSPKRVDDLDAVAHNKAKVSIEQMAPAAWIAHLQATHKGKDGKPAHKALVCAMTDGTPIYGLFCDEDDEGEVAATLVPHSLHAVDSRGECRLVEISTV